MRFSAISSAFLIAACVFGGISSALKVVGFCSLHCSGTGADLQTKYTVRSLTDEERLSRWPVGATDMLSGIPSR